MMGRLDWKSRGKEPMASNDNLPSHHDSSKTLSSALPSYQFCGVRGGGVPTDIRYLRYGVG